MKMMIALVTLMISLNMVHANLSATIAGDRLIGALGDDDMNKKTIAGTLIYGMAAIGGETTSLHLETADNMLIELDAVDEDVKRELIYHASVGEDVLLVGSYKAVKGVAIPVRDIFFVTEIFVNTPPTYNDDIMVCGLGGPMMVNPITGDCVQSLSTCETSQLKGRGYIVDNNYSCR